MLSLTRSVQSTGTQPRSGSGGGKDGWREKTFPGGLQVSAHSSAESSTLVAAIGGPQAGITGAPTGQLLEQQLLLRRLQQKARWGEMNLQELLTKIIVWLQHFNISLFLEGKE